MLSATFRLTVLAAIAASLGMGPALAAEPARKAGQEAHPTADEWQALSKAAREVARSSRVTAENIVVVPDLLVQVLAKLDKIEDKLARIENQLKSETPASGTAGAARK